MSTQLEKGYRFDEFELQPGRRALTRAGNGVLLAPKTFDVLTCLVVNAGRAVTKEELHARLANYLTWTQMYPNQPEPWRDLAGLQTLLGRPDLAIEPARRSVSLAPLEGRRHGSSPTPASAFRMSSAKIAHAQN